MGKHYNDILYTCSILGFIARATNNYPDRIAGILGKDKIAHIFSFADVYHCVTFEESAEELTENIDIPNGLRNMEQYEPDFIPSVVSVAATYTALIEDTLGETETVPEAIYRVMTDEFIVQQIENYNSAFFYSGDSYVLACYKEGKVLD